MNNEEKKKRIIDKIKKFFEKYSGITNAQDEEDNNIYYDDKENTEGDLKVAEDDEKIQN